MKDELAIGESATLLELNSCFAIGLFEEKPSEGFAQGTFASVGPIRDKEDGETQVDVASLLVEDDSPVEP